MSRCTRSTSTATGLDHPGRDEVIASQPPTWRVVLRALAADPLPPGVTIYYQKHMTHHLLPSVDRAALAPLRHAFLIRDPRVAARLLRAGPVRADPDDLGLRQQAEIFEEFGGPVLDSADLLGGAGAGAARAVRGARRAVLAAMLSWPPGPRDSDGVWAPYWYDSVLAVDRLRARHGPLPRAPALDPALEPLLDECLPYYEQTQKIYAERPRLTPGAHACCRSLTNATAT